MKKIIVNICISSAIILVGCTTPEPNMTQYTHSKISNTAEKEQRFSEDNLQCKIFSYQAVPDNSKPHTYTPPTQSGSFTMRNTYTGQEYQGTYSNTGNFGSGFSSGLAQGMAIRKSREQEQLKQKAWEYCMLQAGWHKKY